MLVVVYLSILNIIPYLKIINDIYLNYKLD